MRQAIPIRTINLDINISQTTNSEINENVDINDPEIVEEVTKSIGKVAYRSLRDVLFYIIPSLIQKGVLQLSNPTLHIRISGDGRNVGKKVNHVMVTFALLNDLSTIYYLKKYYTLLIYPGIEKYETLKTVLSPLIQELNEIQSGYLDNEGRQWNICLYFSANWKFLAICLGHKAANAEDFCLWCPVKKKQNGIEIYDWTISKYIEDLNINFYKIAGHKYKPLFPMISLTHWVVDELHVILRITDRLWLLLVSEIDVKTNSRIRNIISQEMLRIHVHFNWWEDQNTKMWTSTSLTGVDKLKVLQNFNLDLLFLNKSRAQLIRRLWNGFNELYEDMHKQRINGVEFKKKALEWINLFLTPSSGNPNHPQTFIKGLY